MIKLALKAAFTAWLMTLLMACSPLKVLNAFTPSDTFSRTSDLAYGPDPRNKLDIYTPKDAVPDAPVVVFFYGGSWTSGSRGDYAFVGEALASRGIVAVLADYRLYPQVHYQELLRDSAQAVAWTDAHIRQFGGDPAKSVCNGPQCRGLQRGYAGAGPTMAGRSGHDAFHHQGLDRSGRTL